MPSSASNVRRASGAEVADRRPHALSRGHAVLGADLPDRAHQLLHQAELAQGLRVVRPAVGAGQGLVLMEASGWRPGSRFHSASVMNGITGWSSRRPTSNVCAATARATSPPGWSP